MLVVSGGNTKADFDEVIQFFYGDNLSLFQLDLGLAEFVIQQSRFVRVLGKGLVALARFGALQLGFQDFKLLVVFKYLLLTLYKFCVHGVFERNREGAVATLVVSASLSLLLLELEEVLLSVVSLLHLLLVEPLE